MGGSTQVGVIRLTEAETRILQMLVDGADAETIRHAMEMELAAREAAAMRYLGLVAEAWPQAEREAAWNAVKAILSSPVAAPAKG